MGTCTIHTVQLDVQSVFVMCKLLFLFQNNLELKKIKWIRMPFSLYKSTGWSR